ncbi:hypothetical protein TTHERM_00753340 (macronuclear) [Tetrahymena thermophila SB210]|uniref:PPPDE peptidase domain protein n=1 Tax=Tetrahymena thermophila (strain SB210) TaxID=312017 RepID=Q23NI6_TETTS|nr:hypothetical protein TTHERM_00753340 [Tetrahymena thermophila SB210]EAR98088.1 hypothetical protein TTHERM_00753340 [Tetrahymena thermophila SB210]|eukprot:XP_001018333.1 hypothetical protein TTHERM_00753340 [Tetrahymena thermophila SB210]
MGNSSSSSTSSSGKENNQENIEENIEENKEENNENNQENNENNQENNEETELNKIKAKFQNFLVKEVFVASRPLQGENNPFHHHGLVCLDEQGKKIIVERFNTPGFSAELYDESVFQQTSYCCTFNQNIQFYDILEMAYNLSLPDYNLFLNNCQNFAADLYKQLTGKDGPMNEVTKVAIISVAAFKELLKQTLQDKK